MATREQQIATLQRDWDTDPRWAGIRRGHAASDVVRLRGSVQVEHTLARRGAGKLWDLLYGEPFVNALGAQTGSQALQQVRAGLKAIYLSGGQPGDDTRLAGDMYPDQSAYPGTPVPTMVRHVNRALQRADQIQWSGGHDDIDYFAPVVAEAPAGGGGMLNAFELMTAMIDAGAAAVHFDDRLAAVMPCGQPGGKVLVPTREAIETLQAARLAADVMGTPTLIIARTDAAVAGLLASDIDAGDRAFCTGERTVEGFYKVRAGIDQAVARALAYAPHADLLWCETGRPDLAFARQFAAAVHAVFPGKLLAYHCSPSFNWKKNLDDATIARFQKALGAMGYRFQFVTLAGLHALEHGMFDLAHGYAQRQMPAFVALQEAEFAAAGRGFAAPRRQRAAGNAYFDAVAQAIRQDHGAPMAPQGCPGDARFFDAQKVA